MLHNTVYLAHHSMHLYDVIQKKMSVQTKPLLVVPQVGIAMKGEHDNIEIFRLMQEKKK